MILLLACANRVDLDPDLSISVGRIATALFLESNFSAPPDDGYGLLLLSTGGVSCENLVEVDTYGVVWLGDTETFTQRQSGLIAELRWMELGWTGAYPVGGQLSTEDGLRSTDLFAYQDGELVALSGDSGVLWIEDLDDTGVRGFFDTLQVQGRFRAAHCGKASPEGYYTE